MNDTEPTRLHRPMSRLPDATAWHAVWPVLLLGALVFAVLDGYWRYVDAPTTRADVGDIVQWSKYLDRPHDWHPFHKYGRMPLFAVLIWFVREVTLGALPDGVVCQIIAVAAWVASLFWVAGIVRVLWPDGTRLGVLAWGLFPFTGIVYVAWPVADPLALSLLAAAIYLGLHSRWCGFVVATNLALVSHKILWPLLFFVALVFWWKKGMPWWHILASGVLLTAYYVFGRLTYAADEPLWLFTFEGQFNYLPESTVFGIPFFDGLRASLAEGGLKAWVKGLIYPSVFVVAATLVFDAVRRRDWLSVAFVVPTMFWIVTLARIEIWVVMRFGHPLVLAACAAIAARPTWSLVLNKRAVYAIVATVLVASQLAWGMGRMATREASWVRADPSPPYVKSFQADRKRDRAAGAIQSKIA